VSQPLLADFTVLDFTRVLAGPYCTRLLADLGARVIKVERPGEGDDTRLFPHQIEDGRTDQSTYFIRFNAGKLSVAVDLAHPEGRAVVLDLARVSDALVENFVPGVMARLGLDYRAAAAVRPDIVYCAISGYGQTGPLRDRPAFAHLINAASGAMDLDRQGDPEPRVAYLQAADALAGVHAFGLIAAALLRRSRTGEGAFLDVPMLQTLWAAEDVSLGAALNGGAPVAGPRPGMIVHAMQGRHVALQFIGGGPTWNRLLVAMGETSPARDARFATVAGRRDHWAELRKIIGDWLDGFGSAEAAIAALTEARVPCAPVLSTTEVIAHPHLAARQAFAPTPHPVRGEVRVTSAPFHVDGEPVPPAGPAPYRAGEHTREVLADLLGYAPARIDALIAAGAVGAP
jgi:crotonobetainyl-CoA:carnitine CoA-transferase CaiB-like acyl-CoA transferase